MNYYSVNFVDENNDLEHYGVLGMKWGRRKARKAGVDYVYKSHGQKKYEKKLKKQTKKGVSEDAINKTRRQLETYINRDKNRQDYAESTTVGKSVLKGLLMGPFGSGNYNRLRAAGHTRLYSAGVSNIVASTLTLPYQIIKSRDDEFVSAKRR